jgi:peptidoglycan/LPS O-acetylase OafA/YrhL
MLLLRQPTGRGGDVNAGAGAQPVHRNDLQGLRAVAVLLVVLDHAGLSFLRGGYVGVDVFFVLSGFLITQLLLSSAARHGRISLGEFYARRARRILPAAVLTLVVTDVVAHELLNFVRAKEAVVDSIWASVFAANVHFAQTGSDYFAQGQPPSPVQHFWTLAVEEQFYVVWPALLSLVLFGALFGRSLRRRREPGAHLSAAALRRALLVVAVAGAVSFAWSVHTTPRTPAAAYFSTFTRAWELALGAALAIAAPRVTRLPAAVRAVSGWAGLACVALAAVAFSASTSFPGYAALLPTLGAALVIGAGIAQAPLRLGAGRLLSLAPLRYVGDRSYAFYLWHWPVLTIAVQYAGHELSTWNRLLLLVLAFFLSILSYAVFENPIRRMRWRSRAGVVLWPASAAAVLAVALPIIGSLDGTAARIEEASAAIRPVALVDATSPASVARTRSKPLPAVTAAARAARNGRSLPSPLLPPVGSLRGDFYSFPSGCAARQGQTTSDICRLGDPNAFKRIVVIGDSHAQMWMPTILNMARRDGWTVIPLVKVGCVPSSWLHRTWPCGRWYTWALRRAAALRPEVALIVASWAASQTPSAALKGVTALIKAAKRSAASVIVVGDSPHQHRNPVDCLLAPRATMKTCTTTAPSAELRSDNAIAAAAARQHVGFLDVRGWFCARPVARAALLCPLVINRTISWLDQGHVSQTYALELRGPFRTAFRRELFR